MCCRIIINHQLIHVSSMHIMIIFGGILSQNTSKTSTVDENKNNKYALDYDKIYIVLQNKEFKKTLPLCFLCLFSTTNSSTGSVDSAGGTSGSGI